MELERLRDSSKEGVGVKKLWAREISSEVEEVWERAQLILGNGKEENPQILDIV